MTTQLHVHTASSSYPLVVDSGILPGVGHQLRSLGISREAVITVITDETVNSLGYPETVARSCEAEGYAVVRATVKPGDGSKSLAVAEDLFNAMLDGGVHRNGVVLAVGGGVVGDLAGFVAATYQRGIPFVQIPTTLLAHDSSIGGKVGVNLPRGKNLVGAFHQPLAVLYDVDTLATLPGREWRGGMAEVIKHSLIGDEPLFEELEAEPIPQFPGAELCARLITRAAAVKIRVVQEDEREAGQRMVLNLGHSVGHAVEHLSHYSLNHGEAIAIGLAVEAEVAAQTGLISEDVVSRIRRVLTAHGLPVTPPQFPFDDVVRVLHSDKKNTSKGWTFSLPRGVGHVSIDAGIEPDIVRKAWMVAEQRGV